eukprot:gnl/MRDRNA2_/MRDRNA2_109659_c0_seq1.p1 gnl/MRDRNA2_/MRDRNA2_109659_c0~~gnl/MRDRNA2_/MRDRNA2_109659_c0_seq1.p1  ORF type:complete len:1195 (-),score=236.31 gnl/MRDRNA2_/MRDRNA2_109659_c0_seq1:75-3263(-)
MPPPELPPKDQSSFASTGSALEDEEDDIPEDGQVGNMRMDDESLKNVQENWKKDQRAKRWMIFDLFFGLFVVINAVLIGIQTDDSMRPVEERIVNPAWWPYIEKLFLFAFSVEFGLRILAAILGRTVCTLLRDNWMYLDLFLILVSASEVFNMLSFMGGNASMLSVIRAFRLVRLMRVIRLIRLLKELWLLVQGMMSAMRILLWTVVLLFVLLYVVGIVMVESVGKSKDAMTMLGKTDEWVQVRWGKVGRAMFTLSQIVTFDGWMEEVEPFWEYQPSICAGLFLFIIIGALGVMNLVVGIMCQTSISVTQTDAATNHGIAMVRNYRALMSLQTHIGKKFGFKNFTRNELKAMFSNPNSAGRKAKKLLARAGMSLRDISMVLDAMDVRGDRTVEVDHLIQALAMLQGDIKDRALDVLLIQLSMRQVHSQIEEVNASIKDGIVAVFEMVDGMCSGCPRAKDNPQESPGADNHETPEGTPESQEKEPKEDVEKDEAPGKNEAEGANSVPVLVDSQETASSSSSENDGDDLNDTKKELDALDEAMEQEKIDAAMARFDGMSSVFVVINSCLVGLQTDEIEIQYLDYTVMDNMLLCIFISELFIRILLYIQINMEADYQMAYFFCPKCRFGRWKDTWQKAKIAVPILMKDPFTVFDVVIIITSIVDNWILRLTGSGGDSFAWLAIGRVFRLIRIARVFRLVRLLKELWLLIRSMIFAARTLVWTVLLLIMLLYVAGILMTETIGKSGGYPVVEAKKWATIGSSMWQLMHLITFDDWASMVRYFTNANPWVAIFLLAFTVVSALGIMNLVVGIMCETAITVVEDAQEKQFRFEILNIMKALKDLEIKVLPPDNKIQTAKSKVMINREQLEQALKEKGIKNKLCTIGKLPSSVIWDVFGKLDSLKENKVELSLLSEAILMSRQPLQNIDVVVCKLMMTTLRNGSWQMHDLFVRLCAEFNVAADITTAITEEFRDSNGARADLSAGDLASSLVYAAQRDRRRLRKKLQETQDSTQGRGSPMKGKSTKDLTKELERQPSVSNGKPSPQNSATSPRPASTSPRPVVPKASAE